MALITGAGQGIGREIARKLASEGALVYLNDLDAGALTGVVDEIGAAGGSAKGLEGDVTAADFPDKLVAAAIEQCGDLHIVVNNAGYIWNGAIHKQEDVQWDAMLDIHAKAPFRILRAAGRYFREKVSAERTCGWRTSNFQYESGVINFGRAAENAPS